MKTMKKIFSMTFILAAALLIAACQGEEADLFDKSAAERLNDVAADYTAILSEPESGWIMEYYPTNSNSDPTGLGYLMLVDFQKDGFVKVGMLNALTEGAYEEALSVWEVITDNGPVLSFSTYNDILHYFSDPAIYDQGNGLSGDYEFVMVDVPEDHQSIMLKGKKRGTYIRLNRLPDGTDFETYLKDVDAFSSRMFSATAPNFDYMTLDGKVYTFDEPSTTLPNIYLKGYDAIANEYHLPFIISKQAKGYSLRFRTTLKFDEEAEGEQEFIYDEQADKFFGVEHAENTLEGANPTEFMADKMEAGSNWNVTYGGEYSATFKTLFDDVYNTLYQNFKGSIFKGVSLSTVTLNDAEKGEYKMFSLAVTYRGVNAKTGKLNSSDSKAYYRYSYVRNDDNTMALKYEGPANDASANFANSMPEAMPKLINAFSRTLAAKAAVSTFNLTNIVISDTSDADFWFNAAL